GGGGRPAPLGHQGGQAVAIGVGAGLEPHLEGGRAGLQGGFGHDQRVDQDVEAPQPWIDGRRGAHDVPARTAGSSRYTSPPDCTNSAAFSSSPSATASSSPTPCSAA